MFILGPSPCSEVTFVQWFEEQCKYIEVLNSHLFIGYGKLGQPH